MTSLKLGILRSFKTIIIITPLPLSVFVKPTLFLLFFVCFTVQFWQRFGLDLNPTVSARLQVVDVILQKGF